VARGSNVAGLVSEGRYDIALPVTGQHWRANHALNPAPLPCNKGEEEKSFVKTAIGSLTLALALIVTPAATGARAEGPRLVPPKEYDRPFSGTVIVVPARDQKHVREMCPRAAFNPGFPALACAYLEATVCRIVMAPDADIKAAGFPPELVKRHEIGHCNGWPADHWGALPYEEWAVAAPLSTGSRTVNQLLFGR
jgi:hypothetical protein